MHTDASSTPSASNCLQFATGHPLMCYSRTIYASETLIRADQLVQPAGLSPTAGIYLSIHSFIHDLYGTPLCDCRSQKHFTATVACPALLQHMHVWAKPACEVQTRVLAGLQAPAGSSRCGTAYQVKTHGARPTLSTPSCCSCRSSCWMRIFNGTLPR